LITGGAGFIGTALTQRLVAAGDEVVILDTLSPQVHGPHPTDGVLYRAVAEVADVRVGDVTDRADVESALAGVDAVVHFAAETGTGQSMYEIGRYVDVNVSGTGLLLDVLARSERHSVAKVVVASSRAIYGEGRYLSKQLGYVYPGARSAEDLAAGRFDVTHPGASDLELVATTEDSTIHPSSIYGITKHTQESLVMTAGAALGIGSVALRYQNVYGPGQSLTNPYTGILSIFSNLLLHGREINIFEDGLESRDFVFIDDVVSATVAALDEPGAAGHILNVGSGVPTSVLTVAETLARGLGAEPRLRISGNFRVGDIRHNYADLTLARQVLGFEPKVTFDEGIGRFAQWVKQQELAESRYEASLDEMRQRGLMK